MQQERTAPSSCETIDLNQGSLPEQTPMDHSDSSSDMVNPVENRLSNYELASRDGIATSCTNADHNCAQSSTCWDRGESSSSAYNLQGRASNDDSKIRTGWSPSFSLETDSNLGDWSFEPPNSRAISMQDCSSNQSSLNIDPNCGQVRNSDCHRGNTGNSSGSFDTLFDNDDSSCLSFGNWGSSCKRKALEGTSGRFDPGASSSSNQPTDNTMQHSYTAHGNLTLRSSPLSLSPPNHSEQLCSRSGAGMRRLPPNSTESLTRNFTIRSNLRHHDSVPYGTPRTTSVRQSGVYASELSSATTLPMIPNNTVSQLHLENASEAREILSYPSNGSSSSRGGSSSTGAYEEVNVRTSARNSLEYPSTVSAPEIGDSPQDLVEWFFGQGTSASSRNHASSSQVGRSSGARISSAVFLPHQNQTSQNHQIFSESAPWIPVPRTDSRSGSLRSQFPLLASASSSSNEAAATIRTRQQSGPRSEAVMMDMPGDTINSWRALAAAEDRHRAIHQVLTAMRRGVHVQAEDYLLIDPFINGFAELHDRHRDLRLDVDNMSYEELLALGERIGNVSTGLSEEKIRHSMSQRKFEETGVSQNLEPCCICQEDYISGDQIGKLDCGHEFHTSCIKEWLVLKNLCPICKIAASGT